MEFKDILKKTRMDKNISQQELASRIYVSRSAIAKWENGLGLPSEDNLEALMNFFEVDRTYFYPPISQEELFKNNKKNKHKINILRFIILFFIIGILAIFFIMIGFNIKFLKPSSSNDLYVETIPGYYVKVYKTNMYKYIDLEDEENYAYGGIDETNIKQMVWNHKELLGVSAYKRFGNLYMENPIAINQYSLKSEDGMIYGIMFVIKDRKDLYHYYYRRVWNKDSDSIIFNENISFLANGKEIYLDDYYKFQSDIDYTKNSEFYLSNIRLYFG